MTEHHHHRIRREMCEVGYGARCSCGWRILRRGRDLREEDVARHLYDTAPHAQPGDYPKQTP